MSVSRFEKVSDVQKIAVVRANALGDLIFDHNCSFVADASTEAVMNEAMDLFCNYSSGCENSPFDTR